MPHTLKTGTKIIKEVVLPASSATTTYIAWQTLQEMRQLPNSSHIKDRVSQISSTANTFIDGFTLFNFLRALIISGAWQKMNTQQRIIISAISVIALGGFVYSLSRFGVEHNTAAAGFTAAGSALFFNSAKVLAKHFEKNNDLEEDRQRLNIHSIGP